MTDRPRLLRHLGLPLPVRPQRPRARARRAPRRRPVGRHLRAVLARPGARRRGRARHLGPPAGRLRPARPAGRRGRAGQVPRPVPRRPRGPVRPPPRPRRPACATRPRCGGVLDAQGVDADAVLAEIDGGDPDRHRAGRPRGRRQGPPRVGRAHLHRRRPGGLRPPAWTARRATPPAPSRSDRAHPRPARRAGPSSTSSSTPRSRADLPLVEP